MGRLHDDDPYVGNTVATYLINGCEITVVGWRDVTSPGYEWFNLYEGDRLLNQRSPLFSNDVPSLNEVETFLTGAGVLFSDSVKRKTIDDIN